MFCYRSLDVMMQVRGCYDAGPNFTDGNTVGESRSTFEKNQCYRLNVWAIILHLTSFHLSVAPLFKTVSFNTLNMK